jgi:hypothetical protein
MKIRLKTKGVEAAIRKAVEGKMTRALGTLDKELQTEAARLAKLYASSATFKNLKTKLVGEFGFTPDELNKIDGILTHLIPPDSITWIDKNISGKSKHALLYWVDYEELKKSSTAQHELTKFNPATEQFELTEVVSWVEWAEEGVTIRGYIFDPTQRGKFSRSRQGIMRQRAGGIWIFPPSRELHNLPDKEEAKIFANLERALKAAISKV